MHMLYYLDTLVAICNGPTMRKSETAKEMVVSEKVIRSSPSFIHSSIHLILSFFSLLCICITRPIGFGSPLR